MKKFLSLFMALFVLTAINVKAAMFETDPEFVQRSSKNFVITFHADQSGVAGLMNQSTLYVHIGLITDKSKDDKDWKYAPSKWCDNADKYKMTKVADNTFQLTIPDFQTYFGMSSSDIPKKIAILARNSGGTAQTSDFLIPVNEDGFVFNFSADCPTGNEGKIAAPKDVTVKVSTSNAADLSIKVDGAVKAQKSNATTLIYTYTVTKKTAFEGVAVYDGTTYNKTLNVRVYDSSPMVEYQGTLKQGTTRNADGSVTFCLAAPEHGQVKLAGSWDNYTETVMNCQEVTVGNDVIGKEKVRYFWLVVKGLENGVDYPYYFNVDGTKVADPCANLFVSKWDQYIVKGAYDDRPEYPKNLNCDMLGVYRSNINEYNWKVKNFKVENPANLIIYEMLFRDFTGTDKKADGTVRAAIEKIPYLKKLGVNAVELMPIMEFNGCDSWGYNTNGYMAPDKSYGSPDDYREFIDTCHQNGIAVILDIVFNQTDGLHPWYKMYSISSNPFYNKDCPHDFGVLNDVRHDYPLWELHFKDVLQYWLKEYKVDGFRFDLVKGLGDNDSYGSGTQAYNKSRVDRMIRFHSYMKEVNPYAIHINENLADAKEENEMAKDGQLNWSNVNEASRNYVNKNSGSVNGFYAPKWSRDWGSTVSYAESHDEQRVGYDVTVNGHADVKANHEMQMRRMGSLAAQMLIAPGAHMIWQFQELGADENTKDSGWGNITGPKKVVWDYLDDEHRAGLFQSYADLCHVRKNNPKFFVKGITKTYVLYSTTGSYVTLLNGNEGIFLAVNPALSGEKELTLNSVPEGANLHLISASYGVTPKLNGNKVTLPAGAYALYGTPTIASVEGITIDGAEARPQVYSQNGIIYVNGEYTTLRAFELSGKEVNPKRQLAPGLYIAVVDGTAVKVLVK